MRYDHFIIWGNGIHYVPQIIDMIRKDRNFDIVMMKSFQIENMEDFIKGIYGCDTYPWEHLVAKTRYLLNSPKEMVFVLVKNKHPREVVKDKDEFEHVECANVVALKIKIRNAFNPPFADPLKQIPPLNPGISHEHCIHGSDYENQTDYVLKLLNLNNLSYYKRYDNSEYFVPYHLGVDGLQVVDKNLDSLYANIIGKGAVPLKDTPHFKYLNGNAEAYTQYFYENFGTNLCEDHFPEAFDHLIQNFDENYVREDGKKSHIIIDANDLILDGVHRAVILKKNNISRVRCIQTTSQTVQMNNYSNLIDLQEYFKNCPHEYCIIKMNEHFPNYYDHSDLDILCTDIEAMIEYTKEFSKKYASQNLKFVVNPLERGHVQIDVYPRGKGLNFKFDFVDNLHTYKTFSVDHELTEKVIRSTVINNFVCVPNVIYDLAIRYLEFIEYDKDRPDKVKHYEYVNQYPEYVDEMLAVIKRHTSLIKKVQKKYAESSTLGRSMNNVSLKSPTYGQYYPIAASCQVPKLSLIYEQYFGNRSDGTFVEVGAFDGEYVSNTSGLSDIGWTGLYFEPVQSFFQKCATRHAKNKNVRVVNTAVGDHEGIVTIHVGGPLSTISPNMHENFKGLDWAKEWFPEEKSHPVPITTLEHLFHEYDIKPGFELLVVDVEGFEWNVFKAFEIDYWKPQMVIVELHDQNDDYFGIREACNNIVDYFDKADYKVIWKDFTNTIYVPKKRYPLPIEKR